MTEVRLIINADDFARSAGVNQGIRRAHREGIVSTTTAMMNLNAADREVLDLHRSNPALGIGVHLNVTFGTPLSSPEEITSLVDEHGRFRNFRDLLDHPEEINPDEVELEWRRQIDRFLSFGIELDHLDSHHHSAVFSEELFEIFLDLATEYECGVRNPNPLDLEAAELRSLYSEEIIRFVLERSAEIMTARKVPHPDALLASFFANQATSEHLKSLLEKLSPGTYELMCHPGIPDAELIQDSSYDLFRQREMDVLTSQEIADTLRQAGIQLHTFRTAWPG
jgi:predicted glycoside hydrolase/deacetylase ChbG (UPF0249 family)